jgi:hypothetical protein
MLLRSAHPLRQVHLLASSCHSPAGWLRFGYYLLLLLLLQEGADLASKNPDAWTPFGSGARM